MMVRRFKLRSVNEGEQMTRVVLLLGDDGMGTRYCVAFKRTYARSSARSSGLLHAKQVVGLALAADGKKNQGCKRK
jgi:hypothetical protein